MLGMLLGTASLAWEAVECIMTLMTLGREEVVVGGITAVRVARVSALAVEGRLTVVLAVR
jgi:hypothetical protein